MTDEEFGDLYNDLRTVLFAYAARRVGVEAAHDVVAETFEVAWRKRGAFPDDRDSWRAWIVGIAKKKVLQELQRRTRKHHDRRFVEDWLPAAVEPTTEDIAGRVAESDLGRRVYEQLSPSDKRLFQIAFCRDLDPSQAAAMLDISLTAYSTRVSRLRQRITALHQEAFDTPRLLQGRETS